MKEIPRKVTLLLLVLSISMCGYGIYRDEIKAVYTKARAVCMECIGIG